MYEEGTILVLKEPHDPDPETGEPFPYNEVEVIGASPVSWGGRSEWSGAAAAGVLIKPGPNSNFGSVLDEPLGKLQALYSVKEVPVREIVQAPIRVINQNSAAAGPTPEEVFAAEAPGKAPEEGQIRGRTRSPLEDPRPVSKDPLDAPKPATQRRRAKSNDS